MAEKQTQRAAGSEGVLGGQDSAAAQPAITFKLTPEQKKLVADNLGLVGVHLRNRVPTPSCPNRTREYEDLFQEGCIALARAAHRYRPERDGHFAAYAFPRIRAAVHEAIFREFTVVPVPKRALEEIKETVADPKLRPPHHVQELTGQVARNLLVGRHKDTTGRYESIRHAIHRRYRVAVDRAMIQLRGQRWRYRNPCEIMDRVARERLLVQDDRERTPLRRIAREMGVSSGRATDYEKLLVRTVAECFGSDPHVQILVKMAGEDRDGFEALMDETRSRELEERLTKSFVERFDAMEPAARAETLYSLLERSAESVPEIARNLYSLCLETAAA